MPELKPSAIVRSRYGDPEAFGERWLEVVADIQSMPYGAKLYAIPADQVLVPRATLERIDECMCDILGDDDPLRMELLALLQR